MRNNRFNRRLNEGNYNYNANPNIQCNNGQTCPTQQYPNPVKAGCNPANGSNTDSIYHTNAGYTMPRQGNRYAKRAQIGNQQNNGRAELNQAINASNAYDNNQMQYNPNVYKGQQMPVNNTPTKEGKVYKKTPLTENQMRRIANGALWSVLNEKKPC